MEKSYRQVVYLFVFVFVLVFIGFYKTYFGLFPTFKDVGTVVHFHAATLILWSIMLFVQPLLIRYKKVKEHRMLGKISYVLAPLIVFGTLNLARHMFLDRQNQMSEAANLSKLYLPISHMFLFSLFYLLAIINKRPSYIHMRYIILASFVVLAPSIARIDFEWTGYNCDSLIISYVFTDVLIGFFILYDAWNKKWYWPYFVALACFIPIHFGTFYFTQSPLWQAVAGKFVQLFF